MDSMKTAQEKGQSFTEFVHDFNSGTGQDTTADGSRLVGTRMHRNSKWVKYWEESKEVGSSNPTFSPEETAHLDSIPHSDTRRRESSCPAHTRLLPRTAEFYHSTREHAADRSRRH